MWRQRGSRSWGTKNSRYADTHTYTYEYKHIKHSTVLHAQIHISQAMALFGFCCSSPLLHFTLHLFQSLPFFFSIFASLVCRGFLWSCFLLDSLLYSCWLACIVIISVSYLDVAAFAVSSYIFHNFLLIWRVCMCACMCLCMVYCIYLFFQFKCIYGRKYILNVLLLHNKRILEELSQAICCITFI